MRTQMKVLLMLLFTTALAYISNKAFAQSGVQFELGLQDNTLKERDSPQQWNDTLSVNSIRGGMYNFEIGVGYQYELNKKFLLRGTILYSRIFHDFSILKREPVDYSPVWTIPIILKQRRITVPIVFQYRFNKITAGVGIEPSIKLKVVSDVPGSEIVQAQFPELISVSDAIEDAFRTFTWSYTALITYNITRRLNINAQYSTNISSGPLKSINFNDEKYYISSPLRRFSFRIGYLLPFAK